MQTDSEDNKNVIRRFLALLEKGDVPTAGNLVSDDVKWWVLGAGDLPRAQLIGLWSQIFGPTTKSRSMRLTDMVVEGNRIAAEFEATLVLQDGRTVLNHLHTVFTLADGKIVAAREYMNTALMEKVFGGH